ncbi:MAG: ATP-binding cassette domain-containing protein, partial [Alphaproteobacteria bacterium]|nr:ATP-binding cassette domain-containing protein [Alphaproteobacteria bacterium]
MLFFSEPKKPRPIQIQLQNVSKSFGDKKVLDGMSLDIRAGESLVIIGGSGTGKSVTLKCILGLLEPESGDIRIGGDSVVRMRGSRRDRVNAKIGMLFQGAALFDSLSVWENVAFVALQQKMPRPKARAMAVATLARVGLPADAADIYPADLSGGMKKRVGLARAIANKPEIIFFDEPT